MEEVIVKMEMRDLKATGNTFLWTVQNIIIVNPGNVKLIGLCVQDIKKISNNSSFGDL